MPFHYYPKSNVAANLKEIYIVDKIKMYLPVSDIHQRFGGLVGPNLTTQDSFPYCICPQLEEQKSLKWYTSNVMKGANPKLLNHLKNCVNPPATA